MAPELCADESGALGSTKASDVYSLSLTFWEVSCALDLYRRGLIVLSCSAMKFLLHISYETHTSCCTSSKAADLQSHMPLSVLGLQKQCGQ
jgi:hypothetical protein